MSQQSDITKCHNKVSQESVTKGVSQESVTKGVSQEIVTTKHHFKPWKQNITINNKASQQGNPSKYFTKYLFSPIK